MSRRMISPQTLIKSQIVDDKHEVDLNEIIEKYGTVFDPDFPTAKTITLQIYNKIVTDEDENTLRVNNDQIGLVVVNGSITITKLDDGLVFIQGMIFDNINRVFIPYLEIDDGSYENGIIIESSNSFDLYVIRV